MKHVTVTIRGPKDSGKSYIADGIANLFGLQQCKIEVRDGENSVTHEPFLAYDQTITVIVEDEEGDR